MLDENTRNKIVRDLLNTYRTRTRIPQLSKTYPDLEIEDSYSIQQNLVRQRVEEDGISIKGYKVGLTSKAMQEQAGSTEPDFSAMTDDWFFPEGLPIKHDQFFSPMIEIEIAFVLKENLSGPGILPVDVIRATDFVLPAVEIVDFRMEFEHGITFVDTVADLAFYGGIVLGANPMSLESIDVRTINGSLLKNGEVLEQGVSSAVLGNPVNSVAWLANKLSEFNVGFKAGDVILSGSFIRATPVSKGDDIIASFDQGLGDVVLNFN